VIVGFLIFVHLCIIYVFVLCGCETSFATLKEEHRLEGVCKVGAEESISTWEGESDKRLKKTA
jgi:hypothetical protein